jgi:glycopeptide antibiotics resistance protein
MLPAADLVFLLVPALIIVAWRGWRRVSRLQLLLRCILVIYAFGVIGVTMFPLPVVPSEISMRREWVRSTPGYPRLQYNLVPGKVFTDMAQAVREDTHHGSSLVSSLWLFGKGPLGNLVMLLPLGYLLPWLSAGLRPWRHTMAIVVSTTLTIELIQLLGSLAYGFPYKRFDVDDILLNSLGGLIGFALWKLTARLLERLSGIQATVSRRAEQR